MDQLEERLDSIEQRIDSLQRTANRIYKMFYWTLVITVVTIVLPLIGMMFFVPKIISSYTASFAGM